MQAVDLYEKNNTETKEIKIRTQSNGYSTIERQISNEHQFNSLN